MPRPDPEFRIYRCMLGMNQRNRAVDSAYGTDLTLAESGAIPEILAAPGISASELGPKLLIGQVGMSRLIAGMRTRGWIKETPSPNDQRRKQITVTPLGERVYRLTQRREYATFAAAFERLSATEQRNFKSWLESFCKGYGVPEVAILPYDPPLMREIEGLSRAIGLLNSKIFGVEDYTPLEWHLLARLRFSTRPVVSTELAATYGVRPNTISTVLLRLEKRDLIKRHIATEDKRLRPLLLSSKGEREYERIEREALKHITRALGALESSVIPAFVSLFERYAGEGSSADEVALGQFESMRRLDTAADLALARSFIVSERSNQSLLEDIPPRIGDELSYIFGLFHKTQIRAVIEAQVDAEKRRACVLHALERSLSASVLHDFWSVVFQQLLFLSGASTLEISRGRCSLMLWRELKGSTQTEQLNIKL